MVELGELEKHHADFEKRNTQIFVASSDDLEDAKAVQIDFPHLTVLSDADRKLISSVGVQHPNAGPHGEEVAAPTTFIIDRSGTVRWVFRPDRITRRLSPDELVVELEKSFATK